MVDPQSNMTYQPFLPEAAAGNLEPRHVVVPLRKVLRKCNVITGAVSGIEHARKVATIQPAEGDSYELGYDLLVVCPGSVSRLLPIPGLAEHGIGFKTIGEAIYLRNHVLSCLDLAASTNDAERASPGAELRLRRRRVRRRRGAGRAGGHGPLRAALHADPQAR